MIYLSICFRVKKKKAMEKKKWSDNSGDCGGTFYAMAGEKHIRKLCEREG